MHLTIKENYAKGLTPAYIMYEERWTVKTFFFLCLILLPFVGINLWIVVLFNRMSMHSLCRTKLSYCSKYGCYCWLQLKYSKNHVEREFWKLFTFIERRYIEQPSRAIVEICYSINARLCNYILGVPGSSCRCLETCAALQHMNEKVDIGDELRRRKFSWDESHI